MGKTWDDTTAFIISSHEHMAWRTALAFSPRIALGVRTAFPIGELDILCFEQEKILLLPLPFLGEGLSLMFWGVLNEKKMR